MKYVIEKLLIWVEVSIYMLAVILILNRLT